MNAKVVHKIETIRLSIGEALQTPPFGRIRCDSEDSVLSGVERLTEKENVREVLETPIDTTDSIDIYEATTRAVRISNEAIRIENLSKKDAKKIKIKTLIIITPSNRIGIMCYLFFKHEKHAHYSGPFFAIFGKEKEKNA